MESQKHKLPDSISNEQMLEKWRMVLDSPERIRSIYRDKPISLMRVVDPGIRFPKKLRILFAMIWKQQNLKGQFTNRFIIKGPRGGGKTKIAAAIGFAVWYLKYYSIVDMAGSLKQAKELYKYFADHCYSLPAIVKGLPSEPTMHETKAERGNYFMALAASSKQVRGPHPDWLLIDEACETDDDLILSAIPMVGSSPNQCVIMTSTFHKIFGMFQEIWDNAPEMGYTRYSWDIIDVVASFDPKIFKDPELIKSVPDLDLLLERIGGRTGDPEGWVRIENIIQAWREKRSIDWFDVEYMGSRPSAEGMVNDPEDVDGCVYDDVDLPKYNKESITVAGLDWGFSGMTSLVGLMPYINEQKVQLESKNWRKTRLDTIIEDVIASIEKFKYRYIYADSAGTFENIELQNRINDHFRETEHRCKVVPVVFSKEKFGRIDSDDEMSPSLLGNYRTHFQRRLLLIPASHKEAIGQHKRYRYQEGSDKPVKKDDHIPDATMCALRHFPISARSVSTKTFADFNDYDIGDQPITAGFLDETF